MAITYTGTTRNYTELAEIQAELYQSSFTLAEGVVDIQPGHKSGTDVYESKVSVTMSAFNTGSVTATGNIGLAVQKTPVSLVGFNYEDTINPNTLKGTRFEKSMKAGAFNIVSDEFDRKILIEIEPAIGEDIESKLWNGATTATKAAIAGLSPGAGQGSITAAAQTAVAAMPTTLFDSFVTRILYNNSQSKLTPGAGLGDYIKVTGTTVTSANIATEYGKLYAGAPVKVTSNQKKRGVIFAPLSDFALIKVANNAVGAAQQINFLIEGAEGNEKVYYNGHRIYFHPLGATFRIFTMPEYLKVLMDAESDLNTLQTGMMPAGSMEMFVKNTQSIATWVTNQRYITLYGG